MAVNIFLLGVAYQAGLIPISLESIQQAIELNGVDVERNLKAFLWGRKYYEDADGVEKLAGAQPQTRPAINRVAELEEYQDAALRAVVRRFLAEYL